jgi:uncharacterized coiled-coil DUF342 family protein
MTEAEIITQLNKKREELADMRSTNASSETLKALEEEIENLMTSLNSPEIKAREQRVFIDECAG